MNEKKKIIYFCNELYICNIVHINLLEILCMKFSRKMFFKRYETMRIKLKKIFYVEKMNLMLSSFLNALMLNIFDNSLIFKITLSFMKNLKFYQTKKILIFLKKE